jgi:hypothetical protein
MTDTNIQPETPANEETTVVVDAPAAVSDLQFKLSTDMDAVVRTTSVKGVPALLAKDVIKRAQNDIRYVLTRTDAVIHCIAIQCYLHAFTHGDTSLMRRLLVETFDKKSGFRLQGLIGHMRMFTPMELKGDVIKLSGMDGDVRRAWRIEEANERPFWTIKELDEQVVERPVFRNGLVGKIQRIMKEYRSSIDNTLIDDNGKVVGPKDVSKPFFNGTHLDEVDAGFDEIEAIVSKLLARPDSTQEVHAARIALKKAELELADAA